MTYKLHVALLFLFLNSACVTNDEVEVQESKESNEKAAMANSGDSARAAPLQTLPPAIQQMLSQNSTSPQQQNNHLFGPDKYDIQAEQTEAGAFFRGLVADTNYSVAIHPGVSGTISLDLKQVTLEQVMQLVQELYGYDIQRTGSVFRVYPAGMRTETFSVNYLQMQRDGSTISSIVSGGVAQEGGNNRSSNGGANSFGGNSQTGGDQFGGGSGTNGINGTNILTRTNTNFWDDLEKTLKALIGEEGGRQIIASPQAGLVTVRAMPDEIRAVREFLKRSEQTVQRQVILEARIVEVSLSDDYQQGVEWTKVLSHVGSTDLEFSNTGFTPANTITGGIAGVTSLKFVNQPDFEGVIRLLSTQGNVQVLSSPRVTATNNQKAVIKVGDDEYFVTEVSTDTTSTASGTTQSPNIVVTPFFSGIALDVTPQIDDKGSVLLHVNPSVIETAEQVKVITLNDQEFELPLAQSNIRQSDTVIRANSGEIVVIGGLMQTMISEEQSKTPLLGDIPYLGEMFTNRREIEQKKELVILIKPTVVGPNTWRDQLSTSSEQVKNWIN